MSGGSEIVGTATGIDHRGRLLIDDAGTTLMVSAGDIAHLREASSQAGGVTLRRFTAPVGDNGLQ